MQRYIYKVRNNDSGSILAWIIIAALSITLIFCMIYFFQGTNKSNYKKYKSYESKIDSEFNEILNSVDEYVKRYNANQLSKREMIAEYKKYSKKLERLYDSFKWKRGDVVTKSLYSIKKNIIISYSQIYYNNALALENNIESNELEELEYISILSQQYNRKDKLQRQIYNIDFQK